MNLIKEVLKFRNLTFSFDQELIIYFQDESSVYVSSSSIKVEDSDEKLRGSSAPSWTSSLAPRFERKAAEQQRHIYYEGEIYEAEEMLNGFTKIRKFKPCEINQNIFFFKVIFILSTEK